MEDYSNILNMWLLSVIAASACFGIVFFVWLIGKYSNNKVVELAKIHYEGLMVAFELQRAMNQLQIKFLKEAPYLFSQILLTVSMIEIKSELVGFSDRT